MSSLVAGGVDHAERTDRALPSVEIVLDGRERRCPRSASETMERVKSSGTLIVSAIAIAACASAVASVTTAGASGRSVSIPNLRGTFVDRGYARLHQDGLRISIPRGFIVGSLAGGGEILQTSPAAGQQIAVGSTVSLRIGCRSCAQGSPAVPTHIPSYTVPSFTGRPLSAVLRWIDPKTLYLTEQFGPLKAATASRLSANYYVARQHPAPGSTLRLGVGHKISPTSGSFLPTPLTVWLAQDR